MSFQQPAPTVATVHVSFTRPAFAGVTAILLVFGATAAIYGPLLVPFSHRFHISLPAAGAVISTHFVGALCGVPLTWIALRRYRGPLVLAAALVVMALGALLAAIAHGFPALLTGVAVIGLGFGGTDYSVNSLLLFSRPEGRARRLSVANAGYSIGAVVGPLFVIAVHSAHYPLIFLALGLGALALIVTLRGIAAPPITKSEHPSLHPRRGAVVGLFVAAYVLYVATETTAAGWIAPQLRRVGDSEALGAAITAGFWLGLAIGRSLAGPFHRRLSERQLVFLGLGLTAALALSASVNVVAPVVYPLAGFSLALVYPMGLIWFANINPGDADGFALLVLTMMAGGVIGPALTGGAVSVLGVRAVPLCIFLFAAGDFSVFCIARRLHPGPLAVASQRATESYESGA